MINNKSVKFIKLDIKKKIRLKNENPDLIFHLAGSLSAKYFDQNHFSQQK